MEISLTDNQCTQWLFYFCHLDEYSRSTTEFIFTPLKLMHSQKQQRYLMTSTQPQPLDSA